MDRVDRVDRVRVPCELAPREARHLLLLPPRVQKSRLPVAESAWANILLCAQEGHGVELVSIRRFNGGRPELGFVEWLLRFGGRVQLLQQLRSQRCCLRGREGCLCTGFHCLPPGLPGDVDEKSPNGFSKWVGHGRQASVPTGASLGAEVTKRGR